MWLDILLLVVGMGLLIIGADFFVDGSSAIAKALKIPTLIIGLTLVSIGTSLPEASVSINSAIKNMNDMSIGNAVGSNIFNTLFILGVSALFVPLVIDKNMKIFDIPIMVGVYGLLMLMCFVITPYRLDIWEGIILLVLFVSYLMFLVLRAKKDGADTVSLEDGEKEKKPKPIWLSIILVIAGGAGIYFGGQLVVDNASKIAITLGMSESLVALTIVSIGTSLPELVTSVVAAIKKENDIAVGNVVGSSIFNILFILGMSATISPLVVGVGTLIDTLVMLASGVIIALIAFLSKKVTWWQGAIMLVGFCGFMTYIIIRG